MGRALGVQEKAIRAYNLKIKLENKELEKEKKELQRRVKTLKTSEDNITENRGYNKLDLILFRDMYEECYSLEEIAKITKRDYGNLLEMLREMVKLNEALNKKRG